MTGVALGLGRSDSRKVPYAGDVGYADPDDVAEAQVVARQADLTGCFASSTPTSRRSGRIAITADEAEIMRRRLKKRVSITHHGSYS